MGDLDQTLLSALCDYLMILRNQIEDIFLHNRFYSDAKEKHLMRVCESKLETLEDVREKRKARFTDARLRYRKSIKTFTY